MEYNISDFDYPIPRHLVAQVPVDPRDSSRLMELNRVGGTITHHPSFRSLLNILEPGDVLVRNNSRVIPSRLNYTRGLGDEVTILLLRRLGGDGTWEFMSEQGTFDVGEKWVFPSGLMASIIEKGEQVGKKGETLGLIKFLNERFLEKSGTIPVPPYIHGYKGDPERYQTVYAQLDKMGSSAAPTAGLHFTESLLEEIEEKGVIIREVTLHVSIDTFMPVIESNPREHRIYKEWVELPYDTAQVVNGRKGRLIAVGTTSVRVLEQSYKNFGELRPFSGWADIFILPGYRFHIDGLITNFHYPRSSNIMMVAAFVGSIEVLINSYKEAIKNNYRFYSFGDATIIL